MPATIVALGEVLWDLFPDGPRFGGAPANFACACASLARGKVQTVLVSAVGPDSFGEEALARLKEFGVDTTHVARHPFETGKVQVTLDSDGRASYRFAENSAWDHLTVTSELRAKVRAAEVLSFGTLGQRSETSRESIRELVRTGAEGSWKVLDLNLRPPHDSVEVILESLSLANVVKLNDEELPRIAALLNLDGSHKAQLEELLKRFSLRVIAFTRGANGSWLLDSHGNFSEVSGRSVPIVDTVGAGDAFTAALALGLLQNRSLQEINEWASEVAAFVCTQPGGTVRFPDSMI